MVVGRKTMFVRTAGCDYRCSWCDSTFTWDGSAKHEIAAMTAEEIWDQLYLIGGEYFDHVTISGGNPALLSSLSELTSLLKSKKIAIALETQGSKWQPWFYNIDDLTISPKPPSSNMATNFNILDEIVENLLNAKSTFSLKVVIFDDADFDYATRIHKRYKDVPFFLQVGNDDIHSVDNEQLTHKLLDKYQWLVDKTMESSEMNKVSILPQLHTLMWGNKRGV